MVIVILFSSCVDDRCGEIVNKIDIDGDIRFVVDFHSSSSSQNNQIGQSLMSDVPVSSDDYAAYDIGDRYCVEQ